MSDTGNMREELVEIIAKEGMIDREKLTGDATLETLGVASYDMVMVLMAIEEKYNVYLSVDSELTDVKTLDQLLDVLQNRITTQLNAPKPEDDAAAPAADGEDAAAAPAKARAETEST